MDHKVTVFSFVKDDFAPEHFTSKDERFVIRCFGVRRKKFIDPRPILSTDFDIFVVQNLRMLPVEALYRIFPLIRQRSRTVHVVHESELPGEPWFYQFLWDRVVYFDRRQDFLKDIYPNAEFIPFPCSPPRQGDRSGSRKKLRLPLGKKIIFVFCQREYQPYLRDLKEELKRHAVLLLVVPPVYEMLEKEAPPPWMIVREEDALSQRRFDDYLFASDAAIFHKFQSRYHRVVSSVIFQVIGAGCPIFVPKQSDFFHPLQDEVVYYKDIEGLNKGLSELLLHNEEKRKRLTDAAKVFAAMNSAEKIAQIYIESFTNVLKEGR
jgi:glycosyltransferase involved in cell wall biosynthesis